MSQAPDRSSEVAAICNQHPEAFQGPPEQADERKLELLRTHIIPGLNAIDGKNAWGLLQKHDQGGKIPADIAVWGQTMEHFDVLTDVGPTWGPKGIVTDPDWAFLPVESGGTTPTPQPPSGGMEEAFAKFDPDVRASLGRIEAALARIEAKKVTAAAAQKPAPVVAPPVAPAGSIDIGDLVKVGAAILTALQARR